MTDNEAGESVPKPRRLRRYEGEGVSLTYDASRCIHAAVCVQGLPAVFNPERRPWVVLDEAEPGEVASVVSRCPTGALRFERQDGGEVESAAALNSITVAADGPLYVKGRLELDGSDAEIGLRAALCRCGASESKPYCDGAHAKCAFSDDGRLAESPVNSADPGTPLRIEPAPNGPVIVNGAFVLESATGDQTVSLGRAALCRCGASARKPFCDGAHSQAGFEAD